MNRSVIFVSLFLASLFAHAGYAEKYVGLVYPPNPPGLVDKGGGPAMGDTKSNSLWYAIVELNGASMVWLEREIGRLKETPKDAWPVDRAIWRVEDVLPFPNLRRQEDIHFGNDIECYFKGHRDASIIAVGKWAWRKNNFGYAQHIRLAWRVNPIKLKFEAISPSKVTCELNEDRD